jgi:hypothetical protein
LEYCNVRSVSQYSEAGQAKSPRHWAPRAPLPEEDLEIVCHGLEARGEGPPPDNGSEPLTQLHVRTIV